MTKYHLFNPGNEASIVKRNAHYTPPVNVACMRADLACLPWAYADAGDRVLSASRQDQAFADALPLFEVPLPQVTNEIVSLEGFEAVPWGRSPECDDLYRRFMRPEIRCEQSLWDPQWRTFFDRRFAALCLEQLSVADKPELPRFVSDREELLDCMSQMEGPFVLKQPFSSSGRGLLWIEGNGLSDMEEKWVAGSLKRQGSISIERALHKRTDFAMEFYSDGKGRIDYLGLSLFLNGEKGDYRGNVLASQNRILARICARVPEQSLRIIASELTAVLSLRVAHSYRGCIGVDMMVYDEGNRSRIHPCVEINLRNTMGLLALKLYENRIDGESEGCFLIAYARKQGESLSHHLDMMEKYPLIMRNGRIRCGYLSLCPVTETTHYRAFVFISPEP